MLIWHIDDIKAKRMVPKSTNIILYPTVWRSFGVGLVRRILVGMPGTLLITECPLQRLMGLIWQIGARPKPAVGRRERASPAISLANRLGGVTFKEDPKPT